MSRRFRPPCWKEASTAAVVCAVAVALVLALPRDSGEVASRRNALLQRWLPGSLREQRVLQPRLTGGFLYRPYRPGGAGQAVDDPAVYRVSREAQAGSTDPRLLTAQAILGYSRERDEESLAGALALLEAARAHSPHDAAVFSDLSAFSFELALAREEPVRALHALAAVERALEIEPDLLEARFNRALYLEYLGLEEQAARAWEAYLEAEPDAGWAAEARQRLAALSRAPTGSPAEWERVRAAALAGRDDLAARLLEQMPGNGRRYLEEELLPGWGTAFLAGDLAKAGDDLLFAARIAALLETRRGDALYAEAVAAIRRASSEGDRRALAALAAAHRDFGLGTAAIPAEEIRRAEDLLAGARDRFELAGSAFAARATLKLAICGHRLGRYGEVLETLGELAAAARARRYRNLLAESLWMAGLAENDRGNLDRALAAYERALPVFEALGEADTVAGIQNLLAERRGMAGDLDRAWRHQRAALAQAPKLRSSLRRYQIYTTAAQLACRAGYPEVGLLLQEEALRQALVPPRPGAPPSPLAAAEAYRWRARIRHQLGRTEDALGDLEQARGKLAEVPAAEQRRRFEAEVDVAEGEIAAATDPAAMAGRLERRLEQYDEGGYAATRVATLLALGRAHAALGDAAAAEARFLAGLGILERARDRLREDERIAFFRLAEGTYQELAALALRQGRAERALELDERRRGRDLLDRWQGRSEGRPLGTRELALRLPAGRALVQYAFAGGKLSAWVVQGGAVRWHELTADREGLERRIDTFRRDLARRAPSELLARDAAPLYRLLVAPLAADLPAGMPLVVVPDGPLHALPFAALYDARRGRFLIEDRPLAVAPSASLYVYAAERDRALPHGQGPRALVVGQPLAGDLPALPGAEAEARRVAGLYPGARPLLGEAATKAGFLAAAGEHEVVHFAGHAEVDPEEPLRSKLLFAADASDPAGGDLLAREIAGASFARTRLVVLGACSTAAGPWHRGEGVAGLARPFLGAGVPAAVASLWRVEDAATSELLVSFHRHLARGGSVLRALRAAQVELLRGPAGPLRSPAVWAAFQLIGEATLGPPPGAPPRADEFAHLH